LNDFIHFLKKIKWQRSQGTRWSDALLYPRWKKYQENGRSSLSERLPWLGIRAADFLEKQVKPDFSVFEYGGGGSTLFWIDRVKRVVTVEHNREWFSQLEGLVHQQQFSGWTGLFVEPEQGNLATNPDAANAGHYASMDEASRGKNYKKYVQAILAYENESFDVVLVDGRARTSCIRDSFPKLKRGGLLILDNAERAYYTENNGDVLSGFRIELQGMGPVYFSRDFSETRIYRKL